MIVMVLLLSLFSGIMSIYYYGYSSVLLGTTYSSSEWNETSQVRAETFLIILWILWHHHFPPPPPPPHLSLFIYLSLTDQCLCIMHMIPIFSYLLTSPEPILLLSSDLSISFSMSARIPPLSPIPIPITTSLLTSSFLLHYFFSFSFHPFNPHM